MEELNKLNTENLEEIEDCELDDEEMDEVAGGAGEGNRGWHKGFKRVWRRDKCNIGQWVRANAPAFPGVTDANKCGNCEYGKVVGNLLVDALHSEYFERQNSLMRPATRLELLDFLEQHGADIQLIPCARNAALNALLPCLGSESDGGATYAWLVKRGLKLNEDDLQNHAKFLQEVGATATLEDLRSQKLLPLPSGN